MSKETMQGLRRGLMLLEQLGNSPEGLGFKEISNLLNDLVPSTVNRLLKTLVDENMIEKRGKNYILAQRSKSLGLLLCGQQSRQAILNQAVQKLSYKTGQTTGYFRFQETFMVMEAKHEVVNGFHHLDIGDINRNLFTHPFGLVILSYLDDKASHKLAQFYGLDYNDFKALFQSIRQNKGLVQKQDTFPGLYRAVAPVFKKDKTFDGAIGISFFSINPSEDDKMSYLQEVKQATEKIELT